MGDIYTNVLGVIHMFKIGLNVHLPIRILELYTSVIVFIHDSFSHRLCASLKDA